jgi:hypothetical protein
VKLVEHADLWILGGRWLAPKLQNKVMDLFPDLAGASEEDIKALVHKAYSSGEGTILQKRVATKLMLIRKDRNIKDWLSDFPPALVVEYARGIEEYAGELEECVWNYANYGGEHMTEAMNKVCHEPKFYHVKED